MSTVIEALVPGGEGLARVDGRPLFVPGAFPGDVVAVDAIDDRRSWARARRWRLLEASADRVAPPCPVSDRCGGCDWMALSRPAQADWKARIAREALRRTGGVDVELGPARAVDPDLGWRRRIRLHVRGGALGFFARGTHDLVPIERCPVARPALNDALSTLRGALPTGALGDIDAVELRVGDAADAGVVAALELRRGARPTAGLKRLARHLGVYALGRRWDDGPDPQLTLLDGHQTFAPPGVFTQLHGPASDALVAALRDGLAARGVHRVLELHAGAGTSSFPLAARFEVTAVESARDAVAAARAAAALPGQPSPRFVEDDAGHAAATLPGPFDAVVLDPPRGGAPDVVPHLARLAPRIAWVACDPVPFARDLKALRALGWTLEHVEAFDLFPHTHHVELLAFLRHAPDGDTADR